MSKIIIRVDASALKNGSCDLALYNTVINGYTYSCNNNDVEFGTATHLFLKHMCLTGGDFGKAIPASQEYFRNKPMNVKKQKGYLNEVHLAKVSIEYWEWLKTNDDFQIMLKEDGTPAVEITFSNKYYEDDEVIVFLEGTIDKFGRIRNGCYAFGDYKTTSSRDIEIFFDGFELSTQLKFYYINLFLFAELNPTSFIAEVCKNTIGAFIDGIFLWGKAETKFQRSRVFFFTPEEIALYKLMLNHKIMKLVDYVKYKKIPYPEGMITDTCSKPENSSGGNWRCRYWRMCAAVNDVARQHILNKDFVVKPYEPLKHGKE